MNNPTVERNNATHPARALWHLIEPIHAVTYFAPACRDSMEAIGLRGFWMGYFASRAAPMGAVDAALVEATFMNFAPSRVRRAIPDAWSFAPPATVTATRSEAAAVALRQVVPDIDEHARRIVPLLEGAARSARCDGRPLAAANQALGLPSDPVERLWQLATTLREHRGDGHVAALVSAGIDGLAALLLAVGAAMTDRASLQPARGWTDAEWEAGIERLSTLGWLDESGQLTETAALARIDVERRTDDAALQPFRDGLTDTGLELLLSVLRAPARAIMSAGHMPFPNPIGLPEPTTS